MVVFPRFPLNSEAGRAYAQLNAGGVNPDALDVGCTRLNYSSHSPMASAGGSDGALNSCEVWSAYASYASRLSASARIFQEDLPWTYEANALSPEGRVLLKSLDDKIAELRSQVGSQADAPLQVARGLFDWIMNGLGMSFVSSIEEQGLMPSLLNRRANCSECFSILKFAFSKLGLEVSPVFVFESATGDRAEHVATMLSYGGHSYLMDPIYHSFDAQHRQWSPLSLREFWAWHYNNRAFLLHGLHRRAEAERLFARAEQLDPYNPHFPNNLGLKMEEMHEPNAARQAYLRAIQIDPRFIEPYVNLSALMIDQRQNRQAVNHALMGLRILPSDPRLHYNLALAYYNLGLFPQAERAIDHALANLSIANPAYISLRTDIRAHRPRS